MFKRIFRALTSWPIGVVLGYLTVWGLVVLGAWLAYPEQLPLARYGAGAAVAALCLATLGYGAARRGAAAWKTRRTPRPVDPAEARLAAARTAFEKQVDAAGAALERLPEFSSVAWGGALDALPWLAVIGPPGSGRTAALRQCGVLVTPLGEADGSGRDPSGWSLRRAGRSVVLEAPGSIFAADGESPAFTAALDVLRARRRRGLDAVLVVVDLTQVLQGGDVGARALAERLRGRIWEAGDRLGRVLPVHVLFTRLDAVEGFGEAFGDWDLAQREQVLGVPLGSGADPTAFAPRLDRGLDHVEASVDAFRARQIARARSPGERRRALLFAAQFAACRAPVRRFLDALSDTPPDLDPFPLRGVWFSAAEVGRGTVDRVEGPLARSLALPPPRPGEVNPQRQARGGGGWFLHDLFAGVLADVGPARTSTGRRDELEGALRRGYASSLAALVVGGTLGIGLAAHSLGYAREAEALARSAASLARPGTAQAPALVDLFLLADRLYPPEDGVEADGREQVRTALAGLAGPDAAFDPDDPGWWGRFAPGAGPRVEPAARAYLSRAIGRAVIDPALAQVAAELDALAGQAPASTSTEGAATLAPESRRIYDQVQAHVRLARLLSSPLDTEEARAETVALFRGQLGWSRAPGVSALEPRLRAELATVWLWHALPDADARPRVPAASVSAGEAFLARFPAADALLAELDPRRVTALPGLRSTWLNAPTGGVPAWYTWPGCVTFLKQLDEKVVSESARRIEGRTPGDEDQVRQQVLERYRAGYTAWWTTWIDGWSSAPPPSLPLAVEEIQKAFETLPGDLPNLLGVLGQGEQAPPPEAEALPASAGLKAKAGSWVREQADSIGQVDDRPCRELIVPFGPAHALVRGAGAVPPPHDALRARFSALRDRLGRVAQGDATARRDAALSLVADTLDGKGEIVDARAAAVAFTQQAAGAPGVALQRLLVDGLVPATWDLVRAEAAAALAEDYRSTVIEPYRTGLAGRFPLGPGRDADPAALHAFFADEGPLASFLNRLRPAIQRSPAAWTVRSNGYFPGLDLRPGALDLLRRAETVRVPVRERKAADPARMTLTMHPWTCRPMDACNEVTRVTAGFAGAGAEAQPVADSDTHMGRPREFTLAPAARATFVVYRGRGRSDEMCRYEQPDPGPWTLWRLLSGQLAAGRRAGSAAVPMRFDMRASCRIPLTLVFDYQESDDGPLHRLESVQVELPDELVGGRAPPP